MIPENFKPLSDVVEDVVSKFYVTATNDEIRDAMVQEVRNQIFPIICEIHDFVASKPTLKRDVYHFVNDTYIPMSSRVYNQWGICGNAFEDIVSKFICGPVDTTELHEIIWPSFVMPLREKIWRLPTVRSRDSKLKVFDQLNDLMAIQNSLAKIIEEVEKS